MDLADIFGRECEISQYGRYGSSGVRIRFRHVSPDPYLWKIVQFWALWTPLCIALYDDKMFGRNYACIF